MSFDLQRSPGDVPDMPFRAANVIAGANIRTVAELIDRPFSELSRFKGMTPALAHKVRQVLAEQGVMFKNDRLRASGGDPLTVFAAVLKIDLTSLDLGRLENLIVSDLRREGVRQVSELLLLSRKDLSRIRGIGPRSIDAIEVALGRLGLMLRQPAVVETVEATPTVVGARALLVEELAASWDEEKANVLADWCEEQEMHVLAGELRRGPSCTSRTLLEAFASMFQEPLRCMNFRNEWKAGWYADPAENTPEQKAFRKVVNEVRKDLEIEGRG